MFTTPLMASLPYSAAPCGPRITSTRSTSSGLMCVSRSGFATSIPSMYILGKLRLNDDAPRMLAYRASIVDGVCSHIQMPGTDPLNTLERSPSSRRSMSRP